MMSIMTTKEDPIYGSQRNTTRSKSINGIRPLNATMQFNVGDHVKGNMDLEFPSKEDQDLQYV